MSSAKGVNPGKKSPHPRVPHAMEPLGCFFMNLTSSFVLNILCKNQIGWFPKGFKRYGRLLNAVSRNLKVSYFLLLMGNRRRERRGWVMYSFN